MHTSIAPTTVWQRSRPLLLCAGLFLLLACTEKPADTAPSAASNTQTTEAAEPSASSAIVKPSKRQLSQGQLDMARSVLKAMKTKQFDAFASHIHPSFAAELKENPKLMEEMANFIPAEDPIKPPKLYALEDVKYEGYGDILMATFDYPYANHNMLFLIAYDAAEGSTAIKSLAVNTFPGSGDYITTDETSESETAPASESDNSVAASE